MISILVTLLLSLPSMAGNSWDKLHLVNACAIHKMNGEKIKQFPGMICQFFDDGSFVTASLEDLKLVSKKNEVKWSISGEYHHQANLSPDRQRILALGTHYTKKKNGSRFGIDKLLIVSLEGKVLHEKVADTLFKHVRGAKDYSQDELTHFNSFYEIPKMEAKILPAYLKEGNIIVNSYNLGMFVLSADLSKILFHQKFKTSRGHKVHDVQVLPNGHYLYFNNIDARSAENNAFSSVQEMDHDGNIVHEFMAGPAFFSLHMGGVQVLDQDHWLITHAVTGNYIYSTKTKSIVENIYRTHYQDHRFTPSQQIKAMNLDLFLSNR